MSVEARARTPEELDTLLEDCLVLRDRAALAGLFEEAAVLISGDARLARGGRQIAGAMLAIWNGERAYVADPRNVAGASGVALIVADEAISVVRRDSEGAWRFLIFCLVNASEQEG